MRDAFLRSLITLAETDDRIALLTGDLGFGVVEKFGTKKWNIIESELKDRLPGRNKSS